MAAGRFWTHYLGGLASDLMLATAQQNRIASATEAAVCSLPRQVPASDEETTEKTFLTREGDHLCLTTRSSPTTV